MYKKSHLISAINSLNNSDWVLLQSEISFFRVVLDFGVTAIRLGDLCKVRQLDGNGNNPKFKRPSLRHYFS